ncbi:hypothetical protein D3C86_1206620 [compost metagenome]
MLEVLFARRGIRTDLRSDMEERDVGRKHTFLEFDSYWCGETFKPEIQKHQLYIIVTLLHPICNYFILYIAQECRIHYTSLQIHRF